MGGRKKNYFLKCIAGEKNFAIYSRKSGVTIGRLNEIEIFNLSDVDSKLDVACLIIIRFAKEVNQMKVKVLLHTCITNINN